MLHYLRDVFPSVLPALDERLREAWPDAGFDPRRSSQPGALPRIRFGTWVGGDRDGHPGVTAEVTAETLGELRTSAVHAGAQAAHARLRRSSRFPPGCRTHRPACSRRSRKLEAQLGPDAAPSDQRRASRGAATCELLLARLPLGQGADGDSRLAPSASHYRYSARTAGGSRSPDARRWTKSARRLAEADVAPVRRSVEVFGFHLAQLDIRQNSVFHAKALTQLLGAAGVSGGRLG